MRSRVNRGTKQLLCILSLHLRDVQRMSLSYIMNTQESLDEISSELKNKVAASRRESL